MSFKKGETVTWKSSSLGTWKEKTGTIVSVVKIGEAPDLMGSGWPRDHESYVVSVPQGSTGKAKPKLYWPRVSALRLVI
jgi:hypothetical protein